MTWVARKPIRKPRQSGALRPNLSRNVVTIWASVFVMGLVCLDATAAQYERALEDKVLTEGLGFEGVLTVYDETPRMFRSLGRDPIRSQKKGLEYTYNSGGFHVVVSAEYQDGRFVIQKIQYSNDKQRRLRTERGIRLMDVGARVTDEYGDAGVRQERLLTYRDRGISFRLDENNRVIEIAVFRPVKRPQQPDDEADAPVVVETSKSARSSTVNPGPLELSWSPGKEWRVLRESRNKGFSATTNDGKLFVRVVSCSNCATAIRRTKRLLEACTRWRAPPSDRLPTPIDWLKEFGADAGSIDVYPQFMGDRKAWFLTLKRDQRWTQVLITTSSVEHLAANVQHQLLSVFRGIRLSP